MPWTTTSPTKPGIYFAARRSPVKGLLPIIFPVLIEEWCDAARLETNLMASARSIDGRCNVIHSLQPGHPGLKWWHDFLDEEPTAWQPPDMPEEEGDD